MIKLLEVYHTKKTGKLRAKLYINGSVHSVKCDRKTNSFISGAGFGIDVIGISIEDEKNPFVLLKVWNSETRNHSTIKLHKK